MNKKIKSLLAINASLLMLFSILPVRVHASPGSLSVSPASGSIEVGKTLTVTLRASTNGSPVNAVKAWLTYNPSDFSVTIDNSGSAFDIQAVNTVGGGSVKIERGSLSPVTGTVQVSRLRLTALRSGVNSNLTYTADSVLVRSTDQVDILNSMSGGSYTLTAPPVTQPDPDPEPNPSPDPGPTNPQPNNPTNPSTPTQTPETPTNDPDDETTPDKQPEVDKTPPEVQEPSVKREKDKLIVEFSSNEASSMELKYGLLGNNSITLKKSAKNKSHKFTLDSSLLVPGQVYTYVLKATDKNGNTTTKEGTFTIPGFQLTVTVKDPDGNNIEGARINIGQSAQNTDENGQALFGDLRPGDYTISVSYNGQYQESQIALNSQDVAHEIIMEFNSSLNVLLLILPLIGIVILAILISFLIRKDLLHLPHIKLPKLPRPRAANKTLGNLSNTKENIKPHETGKLYKPTELNENQKALIKLFKDKTLADIESAVKTPEKPSYTPRDSKYTSRSVRTSASHAT